MAIFQLGKFHKFPIPKISSFENQPISPILQFRKLDVGSW